LGFLHPRNHVLELGNTVIKVTALSFFSILHMIFLALIGCTVTCKCRLGQG
jgi:hypothetical protein